jgi:hypothetical protein
MKSNITFKTYVKWLSYFFLGLVFLLGLAFSIVYFKREEIKQGIITAFNKDINGTITVEKVQLTVTHRFPDFSLSLHDVILRDTIGGKPVLQAERIFLDVGFYALFRNEIHMHELAVENGEVFLYHGMNGYSNLSVFKKSKSDVKEGPEDEAAYTLNLQDISFKNLTFNYVDSLKNKQIAFKLIRTFHTLRQNDSLAEISNKGKMRCDGLTFNADAGSFLLGHAFDADLKLQYDKRAQMLKLLPSSLQLKEDRINIDGEFLLGDVRNFSLHIQSADLLLQHGIQYVSKRIKSRLEQLSVDRPVSINVSLRGKLTKGDQPDADVTFAVENADVVFKKLKMQEVTCSGQYLHRPDSAQSKDENSSIVIKEFLATLEGVQFQGNVSFTRLYDPVMELRTSAKLTASMFNKLVDTSEWVSRSGRFTTFLKYNGRLEEYLDADAPEYHGRLSGNFLATNGSLEYKPKKYRFENVNGRCHFSEKRFTIDSLTLSVNGNKIKIKGTMKNYIPFFIQPANKGYVTLELVSPRLDLSFIASAAKTKKTRQLKEAGQKKITSVINSVQRKLQFDVSLFASEFAYKKFNAKNVNGQVKMDGDIVEASNVQMTVAGGEMTTRFFIRSEEGNRRFLSVTTQVKKANIREFFTMFNDFHQQTIGARNLAGNISATANFSADVLPNYSIDAQSMKGNISCQIRDGRLIDFEPLENLSNFLFKERDFSDVHFAELESYFDIDGTDIDIDRMEVQSSVLSFFIQGRYSFTDSTSMSLQLPLSNLKKRHKGFIPENVGTDGKQGMSVYLHVYRDKDIKSKIKFAYDPFKKWAKKQ